MVNGVSEVIAIRPMLHGPATSEDPAFRIFKVVNNRLFKSEYTEFFGLRGTVGNITGDMQDEILLFHYPAPETYNDGPVDILALSWNGNRFEQIASVSLPRMGLCAEIADLDNDGSEELILLKADWPDNHDIGPMELLVYSYIQNSVLSLVDKIKLPIDLGDGNRNSHTFGHNRWLRVGTVS